MTTIETVKETLGHSNYYMRGTFEVVDEMQGRLTRSGITDWKVGYCHRGQVLPDGAVRVGQVKVRHGDSEYPLWVRPTPDHVEHEPQWQTTCPDCGVTGQLEVYTGKFSCRGMYLHGDGFSFADARDIGLENERVRCTACGSTWDLAFLEVDKG